MKLISLLPILGILLNFSLPASPVEDCSDHFHLTGSESHGSTGVMLCCSYDSEYGETSAETEDDQIRMHYLPVVLDNGFYRSGFQIISINTDRDPQWTPPPPLDKIKMLC